MPKIRRLNQIFYGVRQIFRPDSIDFKRPEPTTRSFQLNERLALKSTIEVETSCAAAPIS
jgi:hypothetical protein